MTAATPTQARLDELRAIYQAERSERLATQRRLEAATSREFAARERAARAEGRAEALEAEVKQLREMLAESVRAWNG